MNDLLGQLRDIVGEKYVLTGEDAKPWASDWTGDYVATPLAVVRPITREEVSAVMRVAQDFGLHVVPVSGNTGLNGGATAPGAILLSLARMNQIHDIRTTSRLAVVGAGVVVDTLDAAAKAHGLCFPLSFGATGSAMIGGVLSTNAGGSNVLRYGTARALCLGLEVVLPDGRILDMMNGLHKDNTGFDLRDLIIGAEGQLGIITGAIMRLHRDPIDRATAMVAMRTLDHASRLLNDLQDASGNEVVAFEFMPRVFIENYRDIAPDAREPFEAEWPVNLLIEVQSYKPGQASDALQSVLEAWFETGAIEDAVIAQSQAQRQEMWARREAAAEISFRKHPVIDADVAVGIDDVAAYLAQIDPLLRQIDPDCDVMSVAHLGDGNIHYNVWPSNDNADLSARLRDQVDALAVAFGGTFSAEHGVGLSKRRSMEHFKDPIALDVMRAIKSVLDPEQTLNPGKTLPAPQPKESTRV